MTAPEYAGPKRLWKLLDAVLTVGSVDRDLLLRLVDNGPGCPLAGNDDGGGSVLEWRVSATR